MDFVRNSQVTDMDAVAACSDHTWLNRIRQDMHVDFVLHIVGALTTFDMKGTTIAWELWIIIRQSKHGQKS
jgi:hypothetical protein